MPELLLLEESVVATKHPALAVVSQWTREYLCRPHPELGRAGPVCPFVPGALQKKLLFATVYEGDGFDKAQLKVTLLEEMKRFIELEPISGNDAQFKALLVLFPGIPGEQAAALIDSAQAELQKHFVPNGLMVGEFHAGPPQKGGLWNPDFRPLKSPVSMLVIRHMVPTDILFLLHDPELFSGYLRIYGNAVPERFRAQFEAACARFDVDPGTPVRHPEGAPRIIDLLDADGIEYRVHNHDSFKQNIRTPGDFARALGYHESRITKTLFVRTRKDRRYLLLAAPINRRVDLHNLADTLGIGRLELASLEELQDVIGYPPTSVTPLAVKDVPIFVDETLLEHSSILTGSGVPRVEIEIAPEDLLKVCGARTVKLS